ncbi:transporter [Streptomyces sp. NPDC006879]|uniref:transporter n=1 Tax=Streptomyces sp. NPDC006879 TaxID=3364767 RepID=UPI0036AF22C6
MMGGLRQSAKRRTAFITSAVFSLLFAAATVISLIMARGHDQAGTLVVLLAAVLAGGWTFMPLLFPTGDETLDATRLVMLPLRPRPLVGALLASSLVGVGPLFTFSLVIGAVIAVTHGGAALAVAVLAAPLLLLTCVALARAVATANVRLLTSRRGRDLAVLSGLLIAIGAQLVSYGWQSLSRNGGLSSLEPVAEVIRWVPPASAVGAVDSASEGSYGRAALQLVLSAVALVLLLRWWEQSLNRLMTAPDSSTLTTTAPAARERAGGGRLSRLLPEGRTGTVMQRTLRYAMRDPKTKSAWVSSLAIGLLVPVFNALQGTGSVYMACFGTGMLGVQMYNQFGQDGPAFWMVSQTISTSREAYGELRARALALLSVTLPYTLLVTAVTSAMLEDWKTFPEVLGVALALLGGMVCTGALASARFPYSIPQEGAFKNVAPGQGALAWMGIFSGLFTSAVLSSPLIALVITLHAVDRADLLWTALPLGIAWGGLICWAGLRLAAPMTAKRLPEILAAVSKG